MNHICRGKKTNLGAVEYKEAVAAVVDLSRPPEISQPNQVLKRERGTYSQYSREDCIKIGKFASKNGNKKTLKRFAKEFPNLKESTVCTFKKSFRNQLSAQTREGNVQPLMSLAMQKHG